MVAPVVLLLALIPSVRAQSSPAPGVSVFTSPRGFPTPVFSSYYVSPAPTREPQPALYDPLLNITFPLNLTDPHDIPDVDTDPVYYPTAVGNVSNGTVVIAAAITRIEVSLQEMPPTVPSVTRLLRLAKTQPDWLRQRSQTQWLLCARPPGLPRMRLVKRPLRQEVLELFGHRFSSWQMLPAWTDSTSATI